MPRLSVTSLTEEKVGEAYPLIRAATRITLSRWEAYVRLVRRRGGDVLVVADKDGAIYGTAAFRTGSTLRHHRCLIVDAIAAFEIGLLATVKGHLCEALQREAIARGCSAILVQTTAPRASRNGGSDQWRGLGFTPESMTIVHELSPSTPWQGEDAYNRK